MIALDTNVVIDLEQGSAELAERALHAIESASPYGPLVVCGIVYAELCASPSRAPADVARALKEANIAVDFVLSFEIWSAAGEAFAAYAKRRRASAGQSPRRIAADFVIGAHACFAGGLVTNDAAFYRRAFPELRVVAV